MGQPLQLTTLGKPPPGRRRTPTKALAAAVAAAAGAATAARGASLASAPPPFGPFGHGRRGAAAVLGAGVVATRTPGIAQADVASSRHRSPRFFTTSGSGRLGGDVVALSDGVEFPKASFGLQVYKGIDGDGKARELTKTAVDVGYRNFFASVLARNQRGFAMGIRDSGIARSDVFICGSVDTKNVVGFNQAYQETKRGCDDNLKAFATGGVDYLDMIMLDYPAADCDSILGQWKAFEEMLLSGTTKSLAVSNFGLTQLDCILQNPLLPPPTVNQLRFNVEAYSQATSTAIIEANKKRDIVVQAWSPQRVSGRKKALAKEIGKRYSKSAAQIMLRWVVQSGAAFTTQSLRKDHLAENVGVFDFKLDLEEMKLLGA